MDGWMDGLTDRWLLLSPACPNTVSTAAVLIAQRHFPSFAALSVSAKTALAISPFFFMFYLKSELQMNQCAKRNMMAEALQAEARK